VASLINVYNWHMAGSFSTSTAQRCWQSSAKSCERPSGDENHIQKIAYDVRRVSIEVLVTDTLNAVADDPDDNNT
jgi:hypothetical protein